MYRFIGVLINDSGTFDIADPMINPIFCEQRPIPRENQTILKVRNSILGIYNTWHIQDDNQEIRELLVLHNTYRFENLEENKPLCSGVVCAALAHAVCIVDERYHFDPSFSYYQLEGEAFYDGKEILKRLSDSPYPVAIRNKLINMITSLQESGKQPTGRDIYDIVKDNGIWDAFCSNKIYSSQWSVDVCNRINGMYPAAVFKGGVVSASEAGFLPCYVYRNSRGMAFAIRISLDMCCEKDNDDINSNKILPFPERTDNIMSVNFSGESYESDTDINK